MGDMRQHPAHAAQMLQSISFLKPASTSLNSITKDGMVLATHTDSRKMKIPQDARIFAVIDTWDSMLSDRPYRRARTEEEARKVLREGAGKQFDPEVVDAFLKMIDSARAQDGSV